MLFMTWKTKSSAIAAMLLFVTVPSAAQDKMPVWLSLTYVDVKPEMDTAFQDLLRTHWLPAAEKSGLEFIAAWRAGSFGDAYQYIFVAPIRKFAEYDGKPPIMAVMAPEDYAVLYQRLRNCVTGVRTIATTLPAGLSYDNRNGAPYKHAIVSKVRVRPGKQAAYAALVKELVPAFEKLDGHPALLTYQTVLGGSPYEWTHVILIDNYAHIDNGPLLTQAVGAEEAARVEARLDELVTERQRLVVDYLPEFSFEKQ